MSLRITPEAARYLKENLGLSHPLTDSEIAPTLAYAGASSFHIEDDGVFDLTEAQAVVGSRTTYGMPSPLSLEQARALSTLADRVNSPSDAHDMRTRAIALYLYVAHANKTAPSPEVATLAAKTADASRVAKLVANGVSRATAELWVASTAPDAVVPSNDDEARASAFVTAVLQGWRVPAPAVCVDLLKAFPPGTASREGMYSACRAMTHELTADEVASLQTQFKGMPAPACYEYAAFFMQGGTSVEALAIEKAVLTQKNGEQRKQVRDKGMTLAIRMRSIDPKAAETESFRKAVQFVGEMALWGISDYVTKTSDLDELRYPEAGEFLARAATMQNFSNIGYLIDELHSREDELGRHGDRLRSGFIATVSTPVLCQMLTRTGGYTSTFQNAMKELNRRDPSLIDSITAYEAGEGKLYNLAQGMVRFRALDELFTARNKLLTPTLEVMETKPNLAGMAIPFIIRVMKEGSETQKKEINTWLRRMMASHMNPGAFVLRLCADAVAITDADLVKQAATLPALPDVNKMLEDLVADKKLNQWLFFYPDETSFYNTAARLKAAGFTVAAKSLKEVTLRRVLGGIEEIIHLSIDVDSSRQRAFGDKDTDLMGHRGHSFHLRETFIDTLTRDPSYPPIVAYYGSCGSAGQVLESGQGNLMDFAWIADEDTGHGAINDEALIAFNTGIAQGKRTWEALLGKFRKNGLLLPDDPAFAVKRYEAELSRSGAYWYLPYSPTTI